MCHLPGGAGLGGQDKPPRFPGVNGTGGNGGQAQAGGRGGGLRLAGSGEMLIHSSTMSGNSTGNGGDGGSGGNSGTTIHNIYAQHPRLAALAENGGPTETHMLLANSPALDGGALTCYNWEGDPLELDQRGEPRAADGNHDGEVLCDIGAVEVQEQEFQVYLPMIRRN